MYFTGSSEIRRFSRMFSHAVSNSMADRHLWVSVVDRPANSRFTRVQRATVCVTLLYVFMGVNAMWYGVLKTTNTSDTSQGISSFGWEEVVLAFLCNIMVFPFSLLLIFIFKKSRTKVQYYMEISFDSYECILIIILYNYKGNHRLKMISLWLV